MPTATRSAFNLETLDGVTCLKLVRGAATPASLNEFGAVLTQMIARPEPARLIVDLSEIDFMPTAMLGHLINAGTRLRGKGGRIRLVGVNPHIAGVFEVTRMKEHFDFHPAVAAAVQSFSGPGGAPEPA